MRKKVIFVSFAVMCMFFVSNSASASFGLGNPAYSLDGTYGSGDFYRGWVNISLNGESGNSFFQRIWFWACSGFNWANS